MRYRYAWEKFYDAVRALALRQGPIKERLANAFQLHLSRLEPEQLPENKRKEFQEIYREMTNAEFGGEVSRVAASIAAMSEQRASEVAGVIYQKFLDIHEANMGER